MLLMITFIYICFVTIYTLYPDQTQGVINSTFLAIILICSVQIKHSQGAALLYGSLDNQTLFHIHLFLVFYLLVLVHQQIL